MDTATNIEKLNFGRYRTSCACGDERHSCTFYVETEYGETTLYVELLACANYWDNNPLKSLWRRIKSACKVLFTGYIDMNVDFIFRSPEQLKQFIDTLIAVEHEQELVRKGEYTDEQQ